MQFIFATNNAHKIHEVASILPQDIKVLSLKDAGIDMDIPEPHNTFKENALEKSNTIFNITRQNCFSEDSGLQVDALNGMPGIKSARYAGEPANDERNIEKLLEEMNGKINRSARFVTIISLILNEQKYFFEGVCEGRIIDKKIGEKGFGYDPVFVPEGSAKTFAEMSLQEKNVFSHRKKALDKLVVFLLKQNESV